MLISYWFRRVVRAGENICVIGAGGVGANVLQFARAFGANKIIAVDVSDDKLKSMVALGATDTINAMKVSNVTDRIKEITGGRGVDVCVEALGRPDTFVQCINSVADGGRCVMVGIAPAGVTADVEITRIVRRSIKIVGSYGAKARQDIPHIITMVQKGMIDVKSPITRRYRFSEAEKAYKDLNAGLITGRAIIDFEKQ
jgi:Zn-dependent alcohol dehydrogenase